MHPICTQYHPICTQYAPNMHPIRTQYAPNTHPIRMDLDHSAEHGRADQKERKRRLYHFFLDRVIGRCTLVSFSGPESLRRTNIVCGTGSTKHAKEYQACKGVPSMQRSTKHAKDHGLRTVRTGPNDEDGLGTCEPATPRPGRPAAAAAGRRPS